MARNFDLSVYFVADPSLCDGRDVVTVVAKAAAGGATMVQIRNKSGNILEFLSQAHQCRAILKPLGIPLIINDRADVAKEIKADGVHLGQEDLDPIAAREMLGPDKIIGVSAFETAQFEKIDPAIIDYAGTGPFYETKTEKGKPILGPEKFAQLVKSSRVPVVGIGGITPENANVVIKSGASGVAMMRSISEAPDPEQAARNFVRAVQSCQDRPKKARMS